jgi:hypothetical protein
MASKNRAQTASVKPTSAEQPLAIIFAHWGIGGDAYKDVTNVVRDHAKPDSIPPASIGCSEIHIRGYSHDGRRVLRNPCYAVCTPSKQEVGTN